MSKSTSRAVSMEEQPLPPNESLGPDLLAALFPLFGLAVVIWAVRLWSRLRPKFRLTPADYIISIAVIAEAASLALTADAVTQGFGRHYQYIDADQSVSMQRSLYISVLTGTCASWTARISIACLLLQFEISRLWRAFLWTLLCLQVAILTAYEVTYLVQCRPIMAMWTTVEGSQCLSPKQAWAYAYTQISIAILADIIFAIMPMFIIWRLSRSRVEKTLVSFLLALSIFASAACGVKIYYLATFDVMAPDFLRNEIPEFLWCRLEEIVVIIAACAPLLKTPVEQGLHRLGLPVFHNKPRQLNIIRSDPHEPGDQNAWVEMNGDAESKQSDSKQASLAPSQRSHVEEA